MAGVLHGSSLARPHGFVLPRFCPTTKDSSAAPVRISLLFPFPKLDFRDPYRQTTTPLESNT